MTENQVLAGHITADYENGYISEEKALDSLYEYRDADKKQGYPTQEIDEYIDSIKYS